MKEEKNLTLTKGEMQVMNILWAAGKACDVHEVVDKYEDPKPAYTTVATFLKILTTKQFVDYKKSEGRQYLFFPLLSKAEYTRRILQDVKDNFFQGSASSLLSFFMKEENLSEEEIQELINMVK